MNTARIMIAGTGSTCGKTTVTCAILKALQLMGKKTASFKCGPDYIDPMFHSYALGAKSRNLDAFIMGEDNLKFSLKHNSQGFDISLIEGVMGFYDGIGDTSRYSACEISNLTDTPALLVVNCKGMGVSVAAVVKGFLEFEKNNIKAVILNNIPPSMYGYYKNIIETRTNTKVIGYLPHNKDYSLESRHLGLITPSEVESIESKIALLGETALNTIDFEALFELADTALPLIATAPTLPQPISGIKIAVAMDKAFCFYYEDDLELLQKLGAKLINFSPLTDTALPHGINGLILGGGYPELYAKELSENQAMKQSILSAVSEGMPTIAQCGGFMYLTNSIATDTGFYPMVGAIKSDSFVTPKLVRFGYATITALEDNLLCRKGDSIASHEFHYSDASACGESFMATKSSGKNYPCVFSTSTLFTGYPHLHFYGNINFAVNFIEKCKGYIKDTD